MDEKKITEIVNQNDPQDDVEGHRMSSLEPEPETDDDVEAHVQPRRDIDVER